MTEERENKEVGSFYVAVTALVLLAALLHRLLLGSPVFPVDDAYITLHNAQVLHWRHDPNYLGTPALAGATSAVHLALVALLLFVLPPTMALWASLWLATLAYALGLVRLARVHGAATPQALLLALVGLAAGQTPHQLMNGLETGLALAAVTWGLALASENTPARRPWLPALCGLLPFIRPDLLPLALGLLAFRAILHRPPLHLDRQTHPVGALLAAPSELIALFLFHLAADPLPLTSETTASFSFS